MAIRFTDEVEEPTVEKAPTELGAILPVEPAQAEAQPIVQEPESKIRFTETSEDQPLKSRIRFTDTEDTQSRIDEIGQIQGIANAAMNAFDASRQSMAVAGGVSPEEAEEISRLEYQKEARKVAPAYQEYLDAGGMDAVKAFAKNPLEISTNIIAEGLAGSLYSLGAGLVAGGTAAGAAAVTGVGAPLAPAAFLGGQIGGTFAGSLAAEYGSKVLEELQNAGMDIKDPESIQKFFSDEKLVEQARTQGLKRGVPVAIFDGFSAGIAGRLARAPIAQALKKTPTRLAATEAGVQAGLGGGGEIAGALAAGEEVQPKAVFAEVLGEAGPAAAEITVGRIATKLAKTPEEKQFDQNVLAAQVATRASQDVAPATADALERQVQDTLVETAPETPEQRVTRLTEEAQKATGIELEEETVARFDQMARSVIIPEIKRFIPEDFRNQLNFIQDRVSKNEFKISDLDETQFKNILSPESYTQIVGLYEEDPELATQTLRNIIEENAGLPTEGGGGEEEAGVGVEPTVPVTPPVEPTPEGVVAPVEPVVEPAVAEPQPVAETLPETIATPEGERARAFYHSGPSPLTAETASFDKGAMGFHMGAKTQAEWVAKDKRKAEISSFYVRDASADQELETESIERDMSWEQADALLVELVSEGILDKQEAIDLANNWGDMSADHKQALSNDLQKVKFGDEYVGMDGDVGEFMLQSSTYKNADKLGQIRQLLVDKGIGAIEYINEVEGVGGNPQAVAIFDKRMLAETPAAPAVTPPAEVAPEVIPTPETIEPLRRVARAEQTEDDVSGLVGQGLVELYNGQPVITQAGLETLPEAERPRLNPEARKIQIDTGSNEVVAEAIAKGLRIGVDQVGTGVRMPAGWTLDGDIYVPPAPQEVTPEAPVAPEVEPEAVPVSEVVPPRPADVEPEVSTEQETQSVVERYQTSEPIARMILSNQNFEAKEAGVIPEGWVVENIDGRDIALSPVWQKSRRGVQVAIRKLTTLERGALSARLSKEGWINEEQAKEYLSQAIRRSSEEQVTAAETEANERFDSLVEGIVRENRSTVSDTVTDVSKPTVDLEAEEQSRAEKPSVDPSSVLDPNEIEFMSARQALKLLAESNIIHKGYEGFEGTGDADAQGNALWRTTGNVTKPLYVRLQEAASVLAKTNLRGLDAERINISGRTSGRAYRSWGGDIFIPRTQGGTTAFLEPWILLHEVGHTLTADALRKYVVQREATGEEYYKRLKKTLADKTVPREVRRAVKLYVDTIKALNIEKEYFKKNGLAGDGDRGIRNASARELKKIINPFTGKEITTDDMYALSDIHEFYAQAWNSDSFQDILKQIKIEPQKSAFQKFVDVIKDILGFDSNTMAYAVIDTSLRLAALEVETDKGSTVEQRIKSTKEFRAVKDLPRTKFQWTGFSGSYSSDRVKMSRNKFSKLGYDQIRFHVKKSGRNEWRLQAEIGQSYSAGKKSNVILPSAEIFVRWLDSRASAQEFAERLASDVNGLIGEKYGSLNKNAPQAPTPRGKPSPKPLLSPAPEPAGREIPQEIPTFSEGSPEAATLTNMKESMAKVDAASEGKPNPENKPTYKISEIASIWMDQGGDARQLQDMVVEYTNLTPANAKKVANAIAKQYGIQQGIAEAGAVIAEPAPEVEGAPRKTSVQRFIEQARGIRKPIVKLEVSERAELKRQIQLKAREARETRKARKEAAKEVAAFITQYVKDNEIRGPIKSRQSMALAKQALKLDVNNEKAVDKFTMYVERVIENANYDADLRQAKALVKKANKLSKSKTIQANQSTILEAISNVNPSLIDNPFEFNIMVERYLLAFAPVTGERYSVFPDSELLQQLGVFESEAKINQDELNRAAAQRLLEAQAAYADQQGISLDEAQELLNKETNIEEDIKALELEKRTSMENLLTDLSVGIQKELNGYDDSANTPAQKELISFLKKVNVENLLADEKKRYIRFSNNLLANGVTYGLEQFKSIALAQDAAIRGAKDERLSKKFSAWITPFTKKAGAQAYDTAREAARKFASITQSEADTIKNIFGRQATGVVKNLLGLTDLSIAQTAANKADEQIANEVDEFYKGHTKKYGNAGVSEETNAYAAIAAYLIQRSGDKTQEDSVAYRRRLLDENIAELNNGERVQQTSEAELKQKIVNDLKGATNAEILNRLKEVNPAAYDQLIWWKDTMLPKWVDFLKAHDENFRNQANNYNTPDFLSIKYMFDDYVKLPTEYEAAGFDDPVSLRVKQAANSIKRKDHPSLPEREGVKANISIKFGKDQYNALTDQVNRAYTAPAWERVYAFTRTPEFEPIMGGRENAKFVKNMLAKIRTAQQGYGGTDIEERMMAGGVAMVRRLASQRALGGFTQMIRQTVPQLVLLAGTSTRWNLALQNMVRFHEGRELMDKFPIGQRANVQGGAKFATQYDELSRRIEASVTNRNWARFRELMKKMGELWMIPLRTSDTWVASVSWMTYYEDELNKRGIQITDWKEEARLVETDDIRKDAAGYAEQQVDQYQGSSDPTKLASLSRQSNSGWREFGRLIVMPLNSFALQEKSRLVSDVRDLFLRSGDRKDAAKGLAGTLGGMLTFHLIAIYLLGAFAMPLGKTMLAGLFGVDLDEPDEEEKEKQLQEKYQQIKTRMFSGVVTGGLGQVVDETGVLAFNRLSYVMDSVIRPDTILNDKGEVVSFRQYEKEFAPLYRYSSFKGNNYSFGLADILSEQAERVMSESGKLLDEDEMSSYTQNEQAFATVATMVEAMYFAGLMDADVTRMIRAGRRQLEQQKKEEEAELARIRAGR
jgi:hypothetical protein